MATTKKKDKNTTKKTKTTIGGGTSSGITGEIFAWEDDPMSNPARPPLRVPVPAMPTGTLGINIVGTAPPVNTYPIGSSGFRHWTAVESLMRGMKFWVGLLPAGTRWSTPDRNLRVHLDMGTQLNAFYRRGTSTLEFFHATIAGRTVYSGESPNVICHELGHALLDAIRPQLWNAASIEAAAFHESFGDMSAILCALQLDSVTQSVLNETSGRLYHSTFLSRVAEELGWAIRQGRPQSVDPDCLRNAVNSFFYRDPTTLPTDAPASALSSAPHSFSRVFTAAFYDALARMIITDNPTPTVVSVKKVSGNAGQLLVDAIGNAPIVPNYFSQIAAQMIAADTTRFNRKYRDVLKGAFVRHGILSLEAAAGIVGNSEPISAAMGMFEGSENNYAKRTELIPVPVTTVALGFSAPTILCAAPDEVGGYPMAAAAALDTGSLPAPTHTEAITSFVEDLLRLGRVDIGEHGDSAMRIAQPLARKTHVLETTAEGLMLMRETFDCGFD